MVNQLSDKELIGFIRAKLKSDYPNYNVKVFNTDEKASITDIEKLEKGLISIIKLQNINREYDDCVDIEIVVYGNFAKEIPSRLRNYNDRGNVISFIEFTDFDCTFNWEMPHTPKGMTDCTNLDIDPKLVKYMCKKFGTPYVKAFKENREEAVEDIQADVYYQYREILTSLPKEQTKGIEDFNYKY